MLKCPMCENQLNGNRICSACGYDVSEDYGKYPVFVKLSATDIQKYEQTRKKSSEPEKSLEKEWLYWAQSVQKEIGALETKAGQEIIQKMKTYYKDIMQGTNKAPNQTQSKVASKKPTVSFKPTVTGNRRITGTAKANGGMNNSFQENLLYHLRKAKYEGTLMDTSVLGRNNNKYTEINYMKLSEAELANYQGNCYYFGSGRTLNYENAVAYYKRAADKGNIDALNNLGNCYYYGNGVKKDDEKAIEYYRKAAEKMNVAGTYNLAYCYLTGTGTKQNKALADTLYERADTYNEVQKNMSNAKNR